MNQETCCCCCCCCLLLLLFAQAKQQRDQVPSFHRKNSMIVTKDSRQKRQADVSVVLLRSFARRRKREKKRGRKREKKGGRKREQRSKKKKETLQKQTLSLFFFFLFFVIYFFSHSLFFSSLIPPLFPPRAPFSLALLSSPHTLSHHGTDHGPLGRHHARLDVARRFVPTPPEGCPSQG